MKSQPVPWESIAGCCRYRFQGYHGYVVPSSHGNKEHVIAMGHTSSVKPWSDSCVHRHEAAEEYYFLLKGVLTLLLSDTLITLRPNEILMVRPGIPHAVVGGEGPIEHIGIRAPGMRDKRVEGEIPARGSICHDGERLLSSPWGYRIPVNLPEHKNCWLIGAGSAKFASEHMVLAYLDFPTTESANAGIGTRHRLHLHQRSWEYYTVLEGTKTLQVEDELVTIEPGHILEVPPQVKHTLHSRTAPYKGLTIRAPIELNDKIEFEDGQPQNLVSS